MLTAQIAQPISGNKLYQKRARLALPLLVRQAQVGEPIYYADLAAELDMPNPRNLNYVLGSIGQALNGLSKQWREKVPPIECLVINKNTELPGTGVGWFITGKDDFRKLSRSQQRRLIVAELQKVFAYRRWPDVLKAFGLKLPKPDYRDIVSQASEFQGGSESEEHRRLKAFAAANPQLIGLPAGLTGITEYSLPSGDRLDVFFQHGDEWIAVEVKSRLSPEADITRGIFQCIKYRAVLEAYQASLELPQESRALLVLEEVFPKHLVPLKNVLGVEVLDRVKPK
jgi:hypothetical protein